MNLTEEEATYLRLNSGSGCVTWDSRLILDPVKPSRYVLRKAIARWLLREVVIGDPYQCHKLSFIDALDTARHSLPRDCWFEPITALLGVQAGIIVKTLPQWVDTGDFTGRIHNFNLVESRLPEAVLPVNEALLFSPRAFLAARESGTVAQFKETVRMFVLNYPISFEGSSTQACTSPSSPALLEPSNPSPTPCTSPTAHAEATRST